MMFLSLGEIMLRFCPGEHPLRASTQFSFSEGGGEYNVARALSRCFGYSSGVVSSLVDNEIGHLVHHLIQSSGINTDWLQWREFDGVGREVRNPLYFAERGLGLRSPKATMDRGHSAPSQMRAGDVDWERIFSAGEVTWFHTGGIFAGLSESSAEVAQEAMQIARHYGVTVSYDPNYRGSLWSHRGGVEAAGELNMHLVQYADVLLGVAPILWRKAPPSDQKERYALMEELAKKYPNLQKILATCRHVHHASRHDFSADLWQEGTFTSVNGYRDIPVLDRIGSGDAFAAGYIAGVLKEMSPEESLQLGCATAALTMSTPGDAVLVSEAEVLSLASHGTTTENR